jgi:hypothetical protein
MEHTPLLASAGVFLLVAVRFRCFVGRGSVGCPVFVVSPRNSIANAFVRRRDICDDSDSPGEWGRGCRTAYCIRVSCACQMIWGYETDPLVYSEYLRIERWARDIPA